MSKGIFISFEGLDGSGKSTQIELLSKYLNEKGFICEFYREPGSTAISEKLREIILDKNNSEMCDVTEALLYAASRAQLVNEKIKPALAEGKAVICDRFVDSSIAYQKYGRNLGELVWQVNEPAVSGCMPDATFIIDVKPGEGHKRISAAGNEPDRLESEKQEFHQKVYAGYMAIAKENPERVTVVDGMRTIDEIQRDIRICIENILADWSF